jgi:aryl-alcohol dehydrogenase-like predicted oxidoreductase
VYTNEEGIQASSDPNIDIVQLPFNLLDNLYQRNEVLQQLKAHGKEVHIRSVLLQGLLLMEEEAMPVKLRPLWKYIAALKEIAAEFKISLHQLALTYALQNNLIDRVLIGVE